MTPISGDSNESGSSIQSADADTVSVQVTATAKTTTTTPMMKVATRRGHENEAGDDSSATVNLMEQMMDVDGSVMTTTKNNNDNNTATIPRRRRYSQSPEIALNAIDSSGMTISSAVMEKDNISPPPQRTRRVESIHEQELVMDATSIQGKLQQQQRVTATPSLLQKTRRNGSASSLDNVATMATDVAMQNIERYPENITFAIPRLASTSPPPSSQSPRPRRTNSGSSFGSAIPPDLSVNPKTTTTAAASTTLCRQRRANSTTSSISSSSSTEMKSIDESRDKEDNEGDGDDEGNGDMDVDGDIEGKVDVPGIDSCKDEVAEFIKRLALPHSLLTALNHLETKYAKANHRAQAQRDAACGSAVRAFDAAVRGARDAFIDGRKRMRSEMLATVHGKRAKLVRESCTRFPDLSKDMPPSSPTLIAAKRTLAITQIQQRQNTTSTTIFETRGSGGRIPKWAKVLARRRQRWCSSGGGIQGMNDVDGGDPAVMVVVPPFCHTLSVEDGKNDVEMIRVVVAASDDF